MKHIKGISPQNESGFSLIELLVYLAILAILMTAVLMSFTQTIRNTATQSSIAETQIETGVGLDLLRADLEHAGFGLPWAFPGAVNYVEPAPMDANNDIPRALGSTDASADSLNNSDYLVIRATNAIRGNTAQKWGYVGRDVNRDVAVQSMGDTAFENNDMVIVINPESTPGVNRQLVINGGNYATPITTPPPPNPPTSLADVFAPIQTPNDPDGEKFLVYGLNDGPVRRPFNRADYLINNANVPTHCAPGTGVLVKRTVNHADDNLSPPMPIVDCVADAQIVYYRDTNDDGGWDQIVDANGLNGLTAVQIREQVKAIRYYILLHEGGIDRTYTYPNANINVGVMNPAGTVLLAGRAFDISVPVGANWANFRWKIESIAVTPKNLQ